MGLMRDRNVSYFLHFMVEDGQYIRGVEPLTMMFFLKGLLPRVLRRDRADEQKFFKI